MGVVPFWTDNETDTPTVVFDQTQFSPDGGAYRLIDHDQKQFPPDSDDCNASYDLRVGAVLSRIIAMTFRMRRISRSNFSRDK